MSKLFREIENKEANKTERISYNEFKKSKKELSKEDFEKSYAETGYSEYSKNIKIDIQETEIDTYLLYEMLKEQRETKNSITLFQ